MSARAATSPLAPLSPSADVALVDAGHGDAPGLEQVDVELLQQALALRLRQARVGEPGTGFAGREAEKRLRHEKASLPSSVIANVAQSVGPIAVW